MQGRSMRTSPKNETTPVPSMASGSSLITSRTWTKGPRLATRPKRALALLTGGAFALLPTVPHREIGNAYDEEKHDQNRVQHGVFHLSGLSVP